MVSHKIHTYTLTHTHTLSLSRTHTLSLSRTHTLSVSRTHTHTLTHTHTHTHTHTQCGCSLLGLLVEGACNERSGSLKGAERLGQLSDYYYYYYYYYLLYFGVVLVSMRVLLHGPNLHKDLFF